MIDTPFQRRQATRGLEQLTHLVRAQSWRQDGTPSLPPTQAAVLRMLQGVQDGLRARHIAERLGVSPASLSDSLKAMEGKQWIRRTPDPDDARAARVKLTSAGSRLTAYASPRRLAAHITEVAPAADDKAVSHKLMPVSVGLAAEVFEGSITDLPNAKAKKKK